MLRFQKNPDKIFTEVLEAAFTFIIDEIEDIPSHELKCFLPHSARQFTKNSAVNVLKDLIKYNKAPGLWRLTDYHYLLIYDSLETFCAEGIVDEIMNNIKKNQPILKRNGFKVWSIDFDALIDIYFFDTDFLMNPEIFVNLSKEHKDQLGFSKEFFGITTGMKPHPAELKIELYEEGEFIPEDPDSSCFRINSREYPDFNLIEVE